MSSQEVKDITPQFIESDYTDKPYKFLPDLGSVPLRLDLVVSYYRTIGYVTLRLDLVVSLPDYRVCTVKIRPSSLLLNDEQLTRS